MSKSKGNGMKPADLVKIFGVDAYRYYFMSDVQFGHDGNISMERMVQVYNADLANTWGNLCSRVFNMTNKYFGGKVPAVPADAAERVANPMLPIVEQLYAKYDACMSQVDFTGAAAAVQELAGRVNLYVEESARGTWRRMKRPRATWPPSSTTRSRPSVSSRCTWPRSCRTPPARSSIA